MEFVSIQQPSSVEADSSDAELMRRLGVGDMSALAELVRRHQQRVRALAYRLTGRWDVADDVAQDTFVKLHRVAGRYRPTAALSTWLYRMVVNLCLDLRRRRRAVSLGNAAELLPGEPAADECLVRRERIDAIQRAVAELPERQRAALVLHRFEGLSHMQIAEVTGWSPAAVESLLVRAYAQLRERLREWSASQESGR